MIGSQAIRAWHICLYISLLMCLHEAVGQSIGDVMTYHVVPSCDSPDPDKPTQIGQYFLSLDISEFSLSEGDFDIIVDRQSILQFHVEQSDVPYQRLVGPFNHTGVGGSYYEYIIRSLSTGAADTLYLPELVCGLSTSNGLNNAGYYCENGYGVVAQVTPEPLDVPELPEKTYVYVLVDQVSQIVENRNFSGHFRDVEDLSTYEIHAFAIPFEEQADFINGIIIGEPLNQDELNTCFAVCGVYDVTVDCSSFDLSLTKNVQEGFVYSVGDLVAFDITVHNDGVVPAYNIIVEDMLPDALDFEIGMNPYWNDDLTSLPIDSILPGESVTIPIYTRVNGNALNVEVINTAEIIFSAVSPDNPTIAFDVDSTPDNEIGAEDDQDDEEIIILENLCDATFEVDAANQAVCLDGPLTMMAEVEMASFPLRYRWRFNGDIVSRDSIYTIENHQPSDYGAYSLTIIDANNCTGTEFFDIEPIDNQERFSCFTDINVGVNSNCEIFLSPEMFTSRPVSGLRDYIIEIRDESGAMVEQSDLSNYGPNTTLEARIVNPCTFETICWSNLHIEHKSIPTVDIYQDERLELLCPEVTDPNPSAIIDYYNNTYANVILDAQSYADSFNQLVCLQEWDVETIDQLVDASDLCGEQLVHRVYYVFDQEQRLAVDTATIMIQPISSDSIRMPEDVFNLTCSDGLEPDDINSYPSFYNNGVLSSLESTFENRNASFCNIGITYADQDFTDLCNFGASKIIRQWTAMDWCSNTVQEEVQYLFVIDKDAPVLTILEDEVVVMVAPFECFATVDLSQYIDVNDFCDVAPLLSVDGVVVEYDRIVLPIGEHDIIVSAEDRCGNKAQEEIRIRVMDEDLPSLILKEDIVISLTTDIDIETNYIEAAFVDAGSHDHDCGPVELTIARASELVLLASEGGEVGNDYDLFNCMPNLNELDLDNDGTVVVDELFRNRVVFCCQDIGSFVKIAVRATDESGNVVVGEISVFVDAKLEWTACDDGDPCTINDRQYGDCLCSGAPMIEDFDNDGFVDCDDDMITICLDGTQLDIAVEQLEEYKSKGAEGGPCNNGESASIAGEVFTVKGDMVEGVTIELNQSVSDLTSSEGFYQFDENSMYERYELYPELDKDYINGVTTLDIVMLEEYILGRRELDDPYLRIAADVNNDGRITALDIIELRLIALGRSDAFSNKSWRFVIEDYSFEDITKPYDFTEINVIEDLDRDMMDENWIGVKIGDLNLTAQANSQKSLGRSKETIKLLIADRKIKKGESIRIPISIDKDQSIIGLQVGFNAERMSFDGVESGSLPLSTEQYNIMGYDYDQLALVWHEDQAIDVRQDLIYLNLTAEKDGQLSDMISIDEHFPKPLVGLKGYEDVTVELEFSEEFNALHAESAQLYQNQPNPFNGETIIQFFIPEEGEVDITFFDMNGKTLYTISDHYGSGVNAIRLTRSDLSLLEGLIYYQMSFKGAVLSRKMVIGG